MEVHVLQATIGRMDIIKSRKVIGIEAREFMEGSTPTLKGITVSLVGVTQKET